MNRAELLNNLGVPTMTAEQEALAKFSQDVLDDIDTLWLGRESTKAEKEKLAVKISLAKDWMAQEQLAAFQCGATSKECAKWIIQNLRDKRLNQ